jgi:aspartyl-tRNA(Asn)/glutamyl-tRNA(Gln) amidotransferase subunit A
LSPLGIGTDLGGSNRLPSHYCGIVGFKPTQGRIPLTGQFPEVMSRHLHVGPLTRTVRDAALALSVLLGPDGRDPYAVPVPAPYLAPWNAPLPPLKVGFFSEGPFAPVARIIQETVTRAAAKLEEMGCRVQPVALEGWKRSKPIQMVMSLLVAEAAHYFEPVVAGRKDRLAPSVQRLLDTPQPGLPEYVAALAGCEQLRVDLMQHFSTHDLLLLPTGPVTAHSHDAVSLDVDGQAVPAVHAAAITPAFGVTGSPAISVPFGMSPDGLPIGVQLVARHFEEATLLRAAAALESAASLKTRRPPL